MKHNEIYWDDLTDDKKKEIKELLDDPDEFNSNGTPGNWDVFPMAIMDIED